MLQLDTRSYWMDSGPLPTYAALDRDISVDVLVIGGGITGITAAYLIKKSGKTVALIDRRRLASVDTGHTTAHLTHVTDLRLLELEKNFGRDHARAVWDAGRAAIWQVEELVDAEQIDCEFKWVSAYLHSPGAGGGKSRLNADDLRKDAELASELGFDARFLDRVPFAGTPGIEFEGQALFHPRKYLRALVERIPGGSCFVFEHTDAEEVEEAGPIVVKARGHRITCDYLVVATHNPLVGKASLVSATLLQTKLALYTSYVVAGRLPSGSLPAGSFWDTADPYSYLRVDRHGQQDLVILGGEDHKTGQADPLECYARLERRLREQVPGVDVTHRWSGQVIETNDGLPFIGETAERQFVATGYGGNGMTFGTLAGMMARDAVVGRSSPWRELFDPGRTRIRGGLWDYITENKDYPYYLIRDRFTGVEGQTLRRLRRGEGKILELDGERVAAYRDADGHVTRLSPICTHMGCVVAWNAAERTWDCPCHGSRFEAKGKVLSGPAESPLSRE